MTQTGKLKQGQFRSAFNLKVCRTVFFFLTKEKKLNKLSFPHKLIAINRKDQFNFHQFVIKR